MGIKLSICIPTYNRADLIGETLESILPQLTGDMEIVIVDGASKDNTEEVVERYRKRFSRIRFFRREKNMGIDRDMDKSVKLAKGEYCWLMSSDDLLKPGAVDAVMEGISRDYGLILVNTEVRNTDMSQLLDPRLLHFDSDRTYRAGDHEELFMDTANYLSFMGAVVIKKKIWDTREKEAYYDTDFVHVGVIFQKAIPGNTLVIAEPFISIRYGNATWSPRNFEVSMFHWPEMIWSFSNISDGARRRVCPSRAWSKLRRLLYHRAKGSYSIREYRTCIEPIPGHLGGKIVAKLASWVPGVLANLLALFYYTFISKSRIMLFNLRNSPYYCFPRNVHGRG